MSLSALRVLRAAGALWTRDRAVLAPLTGLFLFMPQWAVLLLVPEAPAMAEGGSQEAAIAAWTNAVSAWFAANAPAYLGAAAVSQFGMLAIATLYVGSGAGRAETAMARAAALIGRFLLAVLLVWLPLVLIASVLLSVGGIGAVAAVGPVFYVAALALLMLVAPAIAAGERGAARAAARSWTLSRGQRPALVALTAGVVIVAQIASAVLLAAVHSLGTGGAENPVVVAILDAGAAGASWAASVALALSGVVVYRALAR